MISSLSPYCLYILKDNPSIDPLQGQQQLALQQGYEWNTTLPTPQSHETKPTPSDGLSASEVKVTGQKLSSVARAPALSNKQITSRSH
ncbi:unnamed protein product [Gadus morhua 'NCC']